MRSSSTESFCRVSSKTSRRKIGQQNSKQRLAKNRRLAETFNNQTTQLGADHANRKPEQNGRRIEKPRGTPPRRTQREARLQRT